MKRVILMIFTLCIFVGFNAELRAQESYDISKYFPLGIGDKWTYKTSITQKKESQEKGSWEEDAEGDTVVSIAPGEKLDNKEVYLFESIFVRDMHETLYLVLDESGIYVQKLTFGDGVSMVFSPPHRLFFHDGVQLGQKETTSASVKFYSPDNTLTEEGTVEIKSEVIGFEDVVVPAGRFEKCLRISTSAVLKTETKLGIANQVRWFALGIGKVKEIEAITRHNIEGKEETHTELKLKEAIIKGVKFGTE